MAKLKLQNPQFGSVPAQTTEFDIPEGAFKTDFFESGVGLIREGKVITPHIRELFPRDVSGNFIWGGKTIRQHAESSRGALGQRLGLNLGGLAVEKAGLIPQLEREGFKRETVSIDEFKKLLGTTGLREDINVGGGPAITAEPPSMQQAPAPKAQFISKHDIRAFDERPVSRGTRILNEEDLQQRREELAAAGIPPSEWSNYISSPGEFGDDNLYFKQPATLTSPTGEKKIVPSGSKEASDLFKAGFTLGVPTDDTVISSNTMSDEPIVNIGDDTTPTTFQSDTTAGGFDATIKSANDEVKRLQNILVDETPETEKLKTLDELIASLDPDALTGRGAAQLSEEEKRGIEAKTQSIISKTAELKQKNDEISALTQSYNLANTEAEGKPQTLSRLRGQKAQNYRMYLAQKNALTADAAFIQSDLLFMQGQLEAAQNAADRAVDLMFSDRLDKYNATIAKINILQPQVTGDEERYLEGIKLDLENQQAELDELKQSKKDIQNLKLGYIESMATAGQEPDVGVLSSLSKVQSVDQAIDIIGKNLPTGDTSERLSVAEAKSLGVPFGTTKAEAEAMGIIPGTRTGTRTGIGGVSGTGLTQAKLTTAKSNYLKANPDKTSVDFNALSNDDKLRWSVGGIKKETDEWDFGKSIIESNPNASDDELKQGLLEETELSVSEINSLIATRPQPEPFSEDWLKQKINISRQQDFSDSEIVEFILDNFDKDFDKDKLFKTAKEAGFAKWYTGKTSDIKRYIESLL